MSLISTPFLAVLAIIAVGSAAAAVVWWQRLAGRGPKVLAARVGAVLLVQWTAVALVAALINAQFDFYPTLPALLGNVGASALQVGGRPTSGWVSVRTDDAASVAVHHPTRTPWGDLWIDPSSPAYGVGTSLEGELFGAVSHQHNSRLRIWLPRQYAEPAYASYRFPVLMTLTGFPGNPFTWWKAGFVLRVQSAIDSGEVTPFVMAALTPDPSPTRDTECTNVPRGPQVETFLAVDVPHDLTHMVRAAPQGSSWGVMGDSTGGYCSMLLGLDHPNAFGTVVSLGGYTKAITDVTTGNLDGGSTAHRRMRDLLWKVKHMAPPKLAMLMTAATGDGASAPTAVAMAAAARPPLRITRITTQGGGHNWVTWGTQMPLVLRWLGTHLSPAAGLPSGR